MTTFADGVYQFGGMPVTPGIPAPFTGTWFWVDPVNGADGNTGRKPSNAFQTLYAAHAACTAGKNDVVVLMGDGSNNGSARLSTALAQVVDPTATTGTLMWSKNATHLIGLTAPTMNFQRARIAPPTGTYTAATFGSGNFVVVSASGCYFYNFSVYNGFSTGGTNQICWTDTGGRNYYGNVNFIGMADAASANSTGSRSLKVGSAGSGENTFDGCVIGSDTVTRTAANASLELAGATPRNTFRNCQFPFQTNTADVLGIVGTGNGCVDRHNLFDRCTFMNNIKSTSTAMTVLTSFTTASPGGLLLMKDCTLVGIGEFGDTNGLANTYIDGGTVTAASSGIAVNPS